MIWTTSGFQKRPSPPMTRKEPGIGTESAIIATRSTAWTHVSILTFNTLRDRQQNAGNERFTIVRLLENDNLLAETGAGGLLAMWLPRGDTARQHQQQQQIGGAAGCGRRGEAIVIRKYRNIRSGLLVLEGLELHLFAHFDGIGRGLGLRVSSWENQKQRWKRKGDRVV